MVGASETATFGGSVELGRWSGVGATGLLGGTAWLISALAACRLRARSVQRKSRRDGARQTNA